jgi:hypothetical protein
VFWPQTGSGKKLWLFVLGFFGFVGGGVEYLKVRSWRGLSEEQVGGVLISAVSAIIAWYFILVIVRYVVTYFNGEQARREVALSRDNQQLHGQYEKNKSTAKLPVNVQPKSIPVQIAVKANQVETSIRGRSVDAGSELAAQGALAGVAALLLVVVAMFIFAGLVGWHSGRNRENERLSTKVTDEVASAPLMLLPDEAVGNHWEMGSTPSRVADEPGTLRLGSSFESEAKGAVSYTNQEQFNATQEITRSFIVSLDDNGRQRHPLIYIAVGNNSGFRLWFDGSLKRDAEELKLDGLAGDQVYFVTRDGDAVSVSIFELSRDDLKELVFAIGGGSGVFSDKLLEPRMWTDSTGKYNRDASFAGRSGNAVFLFLADPQPHMIVVELGSLSQADQDYVDSQVLTVVARPIAR